MIHLENFDDGKFKIDIDKILIGILIVAVIVIAIILIVPSNENNNKNGNKNNNSSVVTIVLHGENPYYLLKGNPYEEPGYEAVDGNNKNISYKGKRTGEVNYRVSGEYELIYSVENTQVKRKVIVSQLSYQFIDEQKNYTNDTYSIMLIVESNDYLKTILPNKKESQYKSIEYEVESNGTYEFVIYDRHGNKIKASRTVSMIDKEAPTGSCTNKLDVGKTYVEVKATDNLSGIDKYIYNNGSKDYTSSSSKYEYSGLYKNVNVTLVDKVGNKSTIKCVSSGAGAFPPYKFPTNPTEYAESDTLKVAIEKKSGYYIAKIWVLDPYNQINKGLAGWGTQLLKPESLMKNEISKKGLSNKIVIAVNGSGFHSLGAFDPGCSDDCKRAYDKTTEGGLVIADGVVLRNWYSDYYRDKSRNHATFGISKDGYLEVYYNYNLLSESERKKVFDGIISKGYRNTWTFRPVIMLNGKITSSDILGTFLNGARPRNMWCQVNRNNFILITTTSDYNINGIKQILNGLDCQTVVNLDGGGSNAMLFKSKNGSLKTLTGGGRAIADTVYFTEK